MKTEIVINIKSLINELHEIVERCVRNLHRVGQILNALEEAGEPLPPHYDYIRSRGIPRALIDVGRRWARGEYGCAPAELLIAKVSPSVLCRMDGAVAAKIANGRHAVHDVEEGSRVRKLALHEMSRRTVAANITVQGFKPLNGHAHKQPVFRFCVARSFEVGDDNRVMLISSSPDPVRMHIPRKLLSEIIATIGGGQ